MKHILSKVFLAFLIISTSLPMPNAVHAITLPPVQEGSTYYSYGLSGINIEYSYVSGSIVSLVLYYPHSYWGDTLAVGIYDVSSSTRIYYNCYPIDTNLRLEEYSMNYDGLTPGNKYAIVTAEENRCSDALPLLDPSYPVGWFIAGDAGKGGGGGGSSIDYSTVYGQIRDNIANVNTTLGTTNTWLSNINNTLSTASTYLNNINATLGTTNVNLSNINTTLGTTNTWLNNINTSLGGQTTALNSQKTSLDNQVIAINSQTTALNTTLTNQKTSLDNQTTALNNQKTSLDNQVTAIDNQTSTLNTALNNQKSSLDSQISAMNSQTNAINIQTTDLVRNSPFSVEIKPADQLYNTRTTTKQFMLITEGRLKTTVVYRMKVNNGSWSAYAALPADDLITASGLANGFNTVYVQIQDSYGSTKITSVNIFKL